MIVACLKAVLRHSLPEPKENHITKRQSTTETRNRIFPRAQSLFLSARLLVFKRTKRSRCMDNKMWAAAVWLTQIFPFQHVSGAYQLSYRVSTVHPSQSGKRAEAGKFQNSNYSVYNAWNSVERPLYSKARCSDTVPMKSWRDQWRQAGVHDRFHKQTCKQLWSDN
jgi:hypothetical protein